MATEGAPYRVSSRELVYTPLPELGTSGKSARSETNVCGISENDEEFISSAIEMFEVDNIPEGYVTASDLGPKFNNFQLMDLILAYTIIILILITIFGVIILGILWYLYAKKWNKGCERRKIVRLLVASFLVLLTSVLIYELIKVLQMFQTMTQHKSINSTGNGIKEDVFRQIDVLLKTNFDELKQFFTDSENVIASDTFERLKHLKKDLEQLGPAQELLRRFQKMANLGLAIIDFYRFTYRMFHLNRQYFRSNATFDTIPYELMSPTFWEIMRAVEIQEIVVSIIDTLRRLNNTEMLLGEPHIKAVIHNSWGLIHARFREMESQFSHIEKSIKSQLSRAENKGCPTFAGIWKWNAPIYLLAALIAVFILLSVAVGLRGFQSRVPHKAPGARYLSCTIWLIIISIVVIGLLASYQFLLGMMYHRIFFKGKKIDSGRNTKVPIGEYLADHCKPSETLYETLLGYGETPRLNMSNLSAKDIKELKCVYCNFTFDSLRTSRVAGMATLLMNLLHPIDWTEICERLELFYKFGDTGNLSGADCFYRNFNKVSKILSKMLGECGDSENNTRTTIGSLKNVKFFHQLFAHMLYENETLRLEQFKKDPFPDIETKLADSFNKYVKKVNDFMFIDLTSCENMLPRAVEKRCSCEVYTLNGLWVYSFIIFFLLLPILLLSMCLRILYRPPCSSFMKSDQHDDAKGNKVPSFLYLYARSNEPLLQTEASSGPEKKVSATGARTVKNSKKSLFQRCIFFKIKKKPHSQYRADVDEPRSSQETPKQKTLQQAPTDNKAEAYNAGKRGPNEVNWKKNQNDGVICISEQYSDRQRTSEQSTEYRTHILMTSTGAQLAEQSTPRHDTQEEFKNKNQLSEQSGLPSNIQQKSETSTQINYKTEIREQVTAPGTPMGVCESTCRRNQPFADAYQTPQSSQVAMRPQVSTTSMPTSKKSENRQHVTTIMGNKLASQQQICESILHQNQQLQDVYRTPHPSQVVMRLLMPASSNTRERSEDRQQVPVPSRLMGRECASQQQICESILRQNQQFPDACQIPHPSQLVIIPEIPTTSMPTSKKSRDRQQISIIFMGRELASQLRLCDSMCRQNQQLPDVYQTSKPSQCTIGLQVPGTSKSTREKSEDRQPVPVPSRLMGRECASQQQICESTLRQNQQLPHACQTPQPSQCTVRPQLLGSSKSTRERFEDRQQVPISSTHMGEESASQLRICDSMCRPNQQLPVVYQTSKPSQCSMSSQMPGTSQSTRESSDDRLQVTAKSVRVCINQDSSTSTMLRETGSAVVPKALQDAASSSKSLVNFRKRRSQTSCATDPNCPRKRKRRSQRGTSTENPLFACVIFCFAFAVVEFLRVVQDMSERSKDEPCTYGRSTNSMASGRMMKSASSVWKPRAPKTIENRVGHSDYFTLN